VSSDFSRRSLLGASALGLASAAFPLGMPRKGKRPKNILFLVADGMSLGAPSMLDHFLQMVDGKPSCLRGLMTDPKVHLGYQDTRSLNSAVTDSSAASSSWGSGRHVWNGMVNAYPDGTLLRTLYDILGEKKMKRGLVTTATITHATPAGFAAASARRDDEEGIAKQYLAMEIDVLLGGGDRYFSAERRSDKQDLYAGFAAKGYAVARDRTSLAAARGKTLGIFSRSYIPYFVDRRNDATHAGVPGLEEMARRAIDLLKGSREGFILQIEAARVDHAAHSNDFAGLMYELMEFDQTLRMVLEWARNDGETLVVVTSDHGNSNPGLTVGDDAPESHTGLRSLPRMTRSYESILPDFATGGMNGKSYDAVEKNEKIDPTVSNVQGLIERDLSLRLTKEEAQIVVDALNGRSPLKPIDQYAIPASALSIALNNHTHVGWVGRSHTNDYTLVAAYGPGSEAFAGLNPNVTFFDKILACRGLKWNNPTMTREDAARALDRARERALADVAENHWL
jgi:alkaline phosphatase